jgi:tRNA(Ile)-lysidine synthetase-like protein
MNSHLLNNSKKIIVALSGGKDSSSLLKLTQKYCQLNNINLFSAVIINHNLREESKKEAENVAEYWRKNKIKVVIIHWENPISNQKKAREFRLLQLAIYAIRNKVDTIVLGHTLQDKIETYLLRKEKNSTFWGLASIGPITYIYGVKFVRPLLHTANDFIIDYIKRNEIFIVHDSSNNKDIYRRNFIRHHIIPTINFGSILNTINDNVLQRQYYQTLIEEWIKLHLVIINIFQYKFLYNRLPVDGKLACLIIKHIAEKLKGRGIDNYEKILFSIKNKYCNFHVNDCCFKIHGFYYQVREIIPKTILSREGVWHYKYLVVDLLNKSRKFVFFNVSVPHFQFDGEEIILNNQDYITKNNFLIKYTGMNFYSIF